MNRAKCPECGFVGWADAECCKKCGAPVTAGFESPAEQDLQPAYASDSQQPAYASGYQQPAYASGYQNSYAAYQPEPSQRLAVTALVSGIVNFLFLGILVIPTIVGLVISAVALKRINRAPQQYGGKSLAVGGLVMNLVSLVALVPILIIAAIAIPNLLASRRAANEGSAIASLRRIHNAEAAYYEMYEKFGTMADLQQENLIAVELASGTRNGYRFKIETVSDSGDGWPGYVAVGVPTEYGSSGRRSFFIDESGVIRGGDSQGREATNHDPPLNFDNDGRERSASRRKQPPAVEY